MGVMPRVLILTMYINSACRAGRSLVEVDTAGWAELENSAAEFGKASQRLLRS